MFFAAFFCRFSCSFRYDCVTAKGPIATMEFTVTDPGMYEATVERSFAATHAVALPEGSIEPAHRHHWHVRAVFRARRLGEPMGVVVDFLAADKALEGVLGELDGRKLNALPQFANGRSSAERVAEWIARSLTDRLSCGELLHCVRVTEAPGCTASFYPTGA